MVIYREISVQKLEIGKYPVTKCCEAKTINPQSTVQGHLPYAYDIDRCQTSINVRLVVGLIDFKTGFDFLSHISNVT